MSPQDKLPVESQPNSLPDEIDPEKYVIATYYFGAPLGLPIKDICEMAAVEQSTGPWLLVPGDIPQMRKKHVAKVIGIYEGPYPEYSQPKDVTHRHYIVQVAFLYNGMPVLGKQKMLFDGHS